MSKLVGIIKIAEISNKKESLFLDNKNEIFLILWYNRQQFKGEKGYEEK